MDDKERDRKLLSIIICSYLILIFLFVIIISKFSNIILDIICINLYFVYIFNIIEFKFDLKHKIQPDQYNIIIISILIMINMI